MCCGNTTLIENKLRHFFKSWEETSYKLEERQTNKKCAAEEFASLSTRKGPSYKLVKKIELPKALVEISKFWVN